MAKKAKTAVDILKAAKWMIENIGWTQFTNYRGADGCMLISKRWFSERPSAGKIRSMCLRGALDLVDTPKDDFYIRMESVKLIMEAIGDFLGNRNRIFHSIAGFNDSQSKKEVLGVLDKAIKKAERKSK